MIRDISITGGGVSGRFHTRVAVTVATRRTMPRSQRLLYSMSLMFDILFLCFALLLGAASTILLAGYGNSAPYWHASGHPQSLPQCERNLPGALARPRLRHGPQRRDHGERVELLSVHGLRGRLDLRAGRRAPSRTCTNRIASTLPPRTLRSSTRPSTRPPRRSRSHPGTRSARFF